MTSFALTPEREKQLEEILSRYPNRQAATIPVLHLCQDQNGWISTRSPRGGATAGIRARM
jgi:NADH-quinone oxidoreductase subunit E